MLHPTLRKNKIVLTDYSYQRDIENRVLLSHLSVFEVQVLQEILHHSLRFSVGQLAEILDTTIEKLLPILDKLSVIKLFKRQDLTVIVDKEMRKYFEFQIEKFDEGFKPDLEFLQNVLNKVPIHVLPNWYAIPRTSDNIFSSIIEKYFLTPKIYRQYLEDLQFDHPILAAIMRDVYQAPQFKISSAELMAKHGLTRELFEEYLLLLEYHFVCFLSYDKKGDYWEEVITPLSEWRDYLLFESNTKPIPLQGVIEPTYSIDFEFIKDLNLILKACQDKKMTPQSIKGLKTQDTPKMLQKALELDFIQESKKGEISLSKKGLEWLALPIHEQVASLFIDPLNKLSHSAEFESLENLRNIRLIKKSLKRVTPHEWIDLEQFLLGFIAPIAHKEHILLKNKGKNWGYALPTYTPQEREFIKSVIMERFGELGIVKTGMHQGQLCFCLTSFGYQLIH